MNYDHLFSKELTLKKIDISSLKEYLIKKQGWVYIAQSKDNTLLKIGRTAKNPLERAKTLSSVGVLNNYEIVFSLYFFNQFLAEANIHKVLSKYRVAKEFFSVNEDVAIKVIEKELITQNKLLNRFFDTKLVSEDINLLEKAISN